MRAFVSRHWLGVVSLLLVGWALMTFESTRPPDGPSITCRATNPGLQLTPDDGRVFVHPEGRSDEVVAEGALFEAIALPEGRYDIRVLLSRSRDRQSQWLRGVALAVHDAATCEVSFTGGELEVEANAGARDDDHRVIAYVFAEGNREDLVTSMSANETAFIAAGRYDVRVVLTEDSEEKDVEWLEGVAVDTGLRTKMDVAFRRGALLIRAENAGAALPLGAVTFNVHRAGDEQDEVVDSGTAGMAIALPVGRYDVDVTFSASHDKPLRQLHDIEIRDDETVQQTVVFSSGAASIDVEVVDGGPVEEFAAYVYYYLQGDHQEPVAYTRSGGLAVLSAGTYDVRVSYLRSDDQPDLWLRSVVIEPGGVVNRSASFASGKMLVRAFGSDGTELVGDNVFVYVYGAGERTRFVAKARAGEFLMLTAGAYDVRIADTREPGREIWLSSLRVASAAVTEKRVDLIDE